MRLAPVHDALSDQPTPEGPRAGASRLRILQTLRQHEQGVDAEELAAEVGLHVNTVRFHLRRLIDEGLAASQTMERTEPGRPRLSFSAVGGAPGREDKRSYRLLAGILASFVAGSLPDAAESAKDAGRAWGHYLTEQPGPYRRTDQATAITGLLRLLDEIGFGPEQAGSDRDGEIWFRHCPFLEVAEEHREVVCAVHLGLMQGALAQMRAPFTAQRLEPFVEPSLCVTTLGPATTSA